MYDTLLDDFEDDLKTRASQEEEGFTKLPVAEVQDDDIDPDDPDAKGEDPKATSNEDDEFVL